MNCYDKIGEISEYFIVYCNLYYRLLLVTFEKLEKFHFDVTSFVLLN